MVMERGILEVRDVERHRGVDARFRDGRRVRDGVIRRAMVGTEIRVDGPREGSAELVARPLRSGCQVDAIRCGGAQPLRKVDDVAPPSLMGHVEPRPLADVGPRVVVGTAVGDVGNDADMIADFGADRGRRKRESDTRHRIAETCGISAKNGRAVRDKDIGPCIVGAGDPKQAVLGESVELDHRAVLGSGFRAFGGDQSRLDHEGGAHVGGKFIHGAYEPDAARLLAGDIRGLVIARRHLPTAEVDDERLSRHRQETRQLAVVFVGLDAKRLTPAGCGDEQVLRDR